MRWALKFHEKGSCFPLAVSNSFFLPLPTVPVHHTQFFPSHIVQIWVFRMNIASVDPSIGNFHSLNVGTQLLVSQTLTIEQISEL